MRSAIVVVGLVALAAACGGSPVASTKPNAELAFARCLRTHGVPNFPDPNAQGDFPAFDAGVSKQISLAADRACRHFISGGSTATPQQRQQKLEFGLKVSQCLRAHGFPDFPDPTASGLQAPPDIDTRSPQFQAAETTCEKQERKAFGLP